MKTKKLIAFLLVLCLTLGSAVSVFAATSQGTAANITLVKFSGTVTVTNASEKNVSARTGMRLYSGYTITTGAESNAYISLDSSKALLLESSSKLILRKSGNKIDVMLETGTVVCDVSESLTKNQTLDIHTTNMVTGIRGTGVEVSYFSRISATRICMLDGSTQNFNKFSVGQVQVVEAGKGIELGGGAAVVEPMGDSIAVADLQPETQKLMVIDGGISEDVLEGFNEAFGMDDLSEEDAADLQVAVEAAVAEQAAEQQAADEAAEKAAEDALTVESTGSQESGSSAEDAESANVDPVFEDQTEATGTGATITETSGEATSSTDTGSSSGSSRSSGSSGDSGSSQSSTGPVTFTVPGVSDTYSFVSPMVFIDNELQEIATTDGQSFTATPSSVIFWLCYADGSFYHVENVSAKAGSTALSETSAPAQYVDSDGKFFAASSFESDAVFSADMTIQFSYLSEDEDYTTWAGQLLTTIDESPLFSHATVSYDNRDAAVIDPWTNNSKFTFKSYMDASSGGNEEITITVPDGGDFFTVTVSEGGSALTGTLTDNGMVYTTTASSVRFTLVPATINNEYYRISDIGLLMSGMTTSIVQDNTYEVYDVENAGTDYTLSYKLGITMEIVDGDNVDETAYRNVMDPLLQSLSNAPLFGERILYVPNSVDMSELSDVINTNTVDVRTYYTVAFVDTNSTTTYEVKDGTLSSQPESLADRSYTDKSNNTYALTFYDWVRLNTNAQPSGEMYISYDPSETITDDYFYMARYIDENNNVYVIPYIDEVIEIGNGSNP
jgi:hypothetical protein